MTGTGNGWDEYKKTIFLRLDTLEAQLKKVDENVEKIDRDVVRLLAHKTSSRVFHSLVVPAIVGGGVAALVKFL